MAKRAKRQRLRPEVRRERLVEAATEVFAERGYEGARVEQIADVAEVSPGLLYRHFEGKQELYDGAPAARQPGADGPPHAGGRAEPAHRPARARGLDAFFAFVEEPPPAVAMLMKDVLEPEIAEIREDVTRRSVRPVAALAAQDYEGGGDMPHELELEGVAVMVVGAAVSLAAWWNDHPELPAQRDRDRRDGGPVGRASNAPGSGER